MTARLEAGEIVSLPDRAFTLSSQEAALLTPEMVSSGEAKNVSLDPATGVIGGAAAGAETELAALLERYADWARRLIGEIAPAYGPWLKRGRTSFRPRAAGAPPLSARRDDRRLHIDAFPSRPTGSDRILRVFSNINPHGEPRVWRVGESFEDYARRWVGKSRRMWPGEAWLLRRAGLTKARRTAYDALMLGLHDHGKLDDAYQAEAARREVAFPAQSSWIAFTDAVVHAAVTGRYALEQTFYLPVRSMLEPAVSPLKRLEAMTGRRLA